MEDFELEINYCTRIKTDAKNVHMRNYRKGVHLPSPRVEWSRRFQLLS